MPGPLDRPGLHECHAGVRFRSVSVRYAGSGKSSRFLAPRVSLSLVPAGDLLCPDGFVWNWCREGLCRVRPVMLKDLTDMKTDPRSGMADK